MNKQTIYQYWTGPRPLHIEYCMQTVKFHHPGQVVMLDDYDYDNAIETLMLPKTMNLIPQKKADIVRAYFCGMFGGIWIDADYLCFRSVNELFSDCDNKEFAGYIVPNRTPSLIDNDFFWLKGRSDFATRYTNTVCDVLKENNYDVRKWAVLGADILTKLADEHPEKVKLLPGGLITPFRSMILQFDTFMLEDYDNSKLGFDKYYGTMLVNSESSVYLGEKTLYEWFKSKTVIGTLLRYADSRMS